MGSCFSATAAEYSVAGQLPTAKIVTIDGSLIECSAPVSVSQVLGPNSVSGLLCNSDSLNYNEYIPALAMDDMIEPGQLYFVLPIEKLDCALSGPDMAMLAVKASSAIAGTGKSRRRREAVQVVPMREGDGLDEHKTVNELSVGKSSSTSARKKNARSGARLHRSSKQRLSTIEEIAKF